MEKNTHDEIIAPTNEPAFDTAPNAERTLCRRHHRSHQLLFGALFGIIFGFIGGGLALLYMPKIQSGLPIPFMQRFLKPTAEQPQAVPLPQNLTVEDEAVITTVDKTSPAVVSVVISRDVPKLQRGGMSPFGFPFFMMPQDLQGGDAPAAGDTEKQTVGQGSGFIVSADGLIVTNKHVVSATSADYTVITTDGKEFQAQVLARDPNRDIALLKIDAKDLPFLELGNSDAVKVGQTVVAIGNSLGEFSNTVSKGIISGLKRNLVAGSDGGGSERLSNIIQTDAAINPGNSGGPLLNTDGQVIGVNVAMAQGAQSIGFALPANQIKKIIDQVRSTGKITTAFLGVRYIMLTPEIQKENALPLDHGALILRGDKMTDFAVIPGSPADKAGIMENDIIVEINGTKIDNDRQIADIVADNQPGDTMQVTVWHKGETKTIAVTLEEKK
ncbi:MAG: trypsin-like peptidase domain-containing protein [Candidatus Moranbacteria bacterium]|nr:trypsin-like peptidase domain-containing protein [Candidatus Moranbacteria bacterium]